MNPALLAVLINEVAIPELTSWLRSRHAAGAPLTDADVIAKLVTDTNLIVQVGENWLAQHPAAAAPPSPASTGAM
jgi:hypothetical protein